MKNNYIYQLLSIIFTTFLIAACGNHSSQKDGGSGTNKGGKLVANAGADATVGYGEEALLDGSASAPSDLIQKFYWLKVSGPSIVFQQDAENQFITPTEVGTYVFRLFIFSADGRSDTDDVTINVVGKKPIANAGPDQNVIVDSSVTLDGSGSQLKSAGVLNYLWTPVSFPGTDEPSIISSTKTTTFTPRDIGQYTFSLVVFTDEFTSEPDFVTINSSNTLPVAKAGPDRSVFINNTVTLDGSSSTYPDGTVPIFLWEQIGGEPVTLVNKQTLVPIFFAEAKGIYTFALTLKVNGVTSNRDTVVVTVIDGTTENIPIADPGPDQTGFLNEVIELDGSNSSSPKNTPLVYTWSLTGGDPDTINLSNTNSSKISLIATKTGTYQISLVVYDGTFSSASTTVLVNIFNKSDTNLPPQFFEPVSLLSVRIGEPIMLDIGAIDYEDDPISYLSTVQVPKDVTYRIDNGLDPTIIFKPNLEINNLQKFTFTFGANDGISQNTRQTEVRLQPHLYGRNDSRTAIIGRVTDVQGTPLQNATVHCGISFDKTDKNGRFSVVKIPDGPNVTIFVDGRNAFTQSEASETGRTSIYELESFTIPITPFINNKLERDVTLYKVFKEDLVQTRRDKATTVTTFNEPSMSSFKLTVPGSSPMGISSAFTASIAAYEMDKTLTPGEWNYYFNPELLMKVRPHHVKYRIPAPIIVPNKADLPANTILTLWKLDMAKNKFIPINDVKVQGDTMVTENGGLTENGYIFTAISVSGTIRTAEEKPTIAFNNLTDIFLMKKEAIELRKKISTIIAQDKMSKALGAMSYLSSFEKAYKNGFLDNNSLANIAYLRLKSKYSKGTDLANDILNASVIGDEIITALGPMETRLINFLKTIKRDSILTEQINDLQELLQSDTFDLENDAEVLRIKDLIAKRKAQIALINKPLQLMVFTNDTFTEVAAAKIQEPVELCAKLYTKAHPYYDALVRLDEFIDKIVEIIDAHSQPNDKEIMSVLQVMNASGAVDEVISIKTYDSETYIGNLDTRTDLLGKTVRVASYSKTANKYGFSRSIILGKESATDLDVYMNTDAQLVVYEQPDEALKDFPAFVEIQKADKTVFLKALNANTFVEIPIGTYNAKAISSKQKTTLIPFTISLKKSYFIRFGQVEVNTIENVTYQKESLVFYNQTLNLTYDKIEINDLVILPAGTYIVRSASSEPTDFWSGTVTLATGETKRPFGTMQYATFNATDTYNFDYSIIAANGKTAYKSVKLGNSVVLLPGNYRFKAVQTSTQIEQHSLQILVTNDELVNPFGIIVVNAFSPLPFEFDNFKVEFFKDDTLLVTDLTPGKELLVLPGKYRMRVVGMSSIMKYIINLDTEDILSVMGIVRFTETDKKYNISQDGNLIYQNVGAGKAVLLTPGLYSLDAVEDDGIPPQAFNVVFNSTFTYPDDTIITKKH